MREEGQPRVLPLLGNDVALSKEVGKRTSVGMNHKRVRSMSAFQDRKKLVIKNEVVFSPARLNRMPVQMLCSSASGEAVMPVTSHD